MIVNHFTNGVRGSLKIELLFLKSKIVINMNTSKKFNVSGNKRTRIGIILFFFRVVLGLMLFTKGLIFLRNDGILRQVFSDTAFIHNFSLLKFLIPSIHLLGGFLILIGLYTRLMALLQLPLVIGAIIVLLNARYYPFFYAEILFALAILILLFIFLKFGDGFYSWRNLLQKDDH